MSNCSLCSDNSSCNIAKQITKNLDEYRKKYQLEKEFIYDENIHSYPITLMLSLTNQCNLSCPYCFVDQNNKTMAYSTAEQAIEWLKGNYIHRGYDLNNHKMSINFFGGEPLLYFDSLIKPLVEKYKDIVSFGITTNGILLDEDIVDFFYENNIQPLLSFDGVEQVQNSQRPGKNINSFEKVLRNIPYLLIRFPDTVMRATLTKDSIPYMFQSVIMAEELGFRSITFCPNAFEDWDEDIFKQLHYQYEKISLYIYKKLLNNEFPIQVDPIISAFQTIESTIENGAVFNNAIMRCGLGTNTCAITPEGLIVPCQEKTSKPEYNIGNIWDGIDKEKHKAFLNNYFNSVNNLTCPNNCSEREKSFCLSNLCPSRLEDLNYNISTSECLFYRSAFEIGRRLHFLCSQSGLPIVNLYFSEKEDYPC